MPEIEKSFFELSLPQVFETLKTSESGLSSDEAKRRLEEFGKNKLPEAKSKSLWKIFLEQFQSPLIYVLVIASFLVLYIGETSDSLIIFSVLVFNAVVGTVQEGKAQNTLRALQNLAATNGTVFRDGKEVILTDVEVVPGDIILIKEGEKIPADARLIKANSLKINEASLTGESEPVVKNPESVARKNQSLGDQLNSVFKGTTCVYGNATALVVATGEKTEIGKISKAIASIDTEIPLKKNIRDLSRLIIITLFITSLILFLLGVLYFDKSLSEMFATVISLIVSAIPEGLPIVITMVLATGVYRMSKRNALVKKLQAVEALGQAEIIAIDKTGTLTKNEMVVRGIFAGSQFFDISGVGYETKGVIKSENKIIEPLDFPALVAVARTSALSAEAEVAKNEKTGVWRVVGDPTEAAMIVFAEKIGFRKTDLVESAKKIFEIPFDYKTKFRAVVHEENRGKGTLIPLARHNLDEGGSESATRGKILTIAGAPEVILNLSSKIFENEKNSTFTAKKKGEVEKIFSDYSAKGFRVLAVGEYKNSKSFYEPANLPPITFLGLLFIQDPLKEEVKDSVKKIQSAGMKVVMITGDHKLTAVSIAKEAGIWKEGDEIMSGVEVDELSEEELSNRLEKISVFARVNPEHKIKIIKAYKKIGKIIAMTGDGVNDAPSLVGADLGVAMGKIGTEVAKEAADIVLLDDNLESIVAAIEEGRNIYKTIKKVLVYLFSTNIGEILTIALALVLFFPLPVLPAQIIWLNLVTDGFLTIALALEPKGSKLLLGKFKKPNRYIVGLDDLARMILMAGVMMVGALYLFQNVFPENLLKAQTITLTTLAVFQWFNAWNVRSESTSIFKTKFFSNPSLIVATLIVISLQLLAIYTPFFQGLLKTVPLGAKEWGAILSVGFTIIIAEEIRKFVKRRYFSTEAV
ncbi:MAG: HAD-IC family P-type ATPase [Patescibacteria group bacterium]